MPEGDPNDQDTPAVEVSPEVLAKAGRAMAEMVTKDTPAILAGADNVTDEANQIADMLARSLLGTPPEPEAPEPAVGDEPPAPPAEAPPAEPPPELKPEDIDVELREVLAEPAPFYRCKRGHVQQGGFRHNIPPNPAVNHKGRPGKPVCRECEFQWLEQKFPTVLVVPKKKPQLASVPLDPPANDTAPAPAPAPKKERRNARGLLLPDHDDGDFVCDCVCCRGVCECDRHHADPEVPPEPAPA